MPRTVHVHLLPAHIEPGALAGGIAVIVDQLRASTTICAALHSGATRVIPVHEPDEALRIKAGAQPGTILTGGERHGILIPGFDLDNSPRAYTPERVRGKAIAFTTTNGTRAVLHAQRASGILIGCLANLAALVRALAADPRPVHILCAGTNGKVAPEDVLVGGAIASGIAHARDDTLPTPDDSTRLAMTQWRAVRSSPAGILAALQSAPGGRNLIEIGLHEDVEYCARMDILPIVPEWHASARSFMRGGIPA